MRRIAKRVGVYASLCSLTVIWGASAQPDQAQLSNGAELVNACRQAPGDSPEQAGLCEGYLLGYLQANPEVVFREQLPSGYMQRVMRTRAPVHPQTASIKTPTYCLDGMKSIDDLRSEIAGLDPDSVQLLPSANVVATLLEAHHRC